jgi:hypothetical protein
MATRQSPFWNAEYLGEEASPSVGYMELLPFDSSPAGSGPFRVDTSGNVTAGNITANSINAQIGLKPSGGDDTARLQAVLNLGIPLILGLGTFETTSDLLPPPGSVIEGALGADPLVWGDVGTVIKPAVGYTGTAVINCKDVNHTLTQGPVLRDFSIDAVNLGGSIDALRATGPVNAGVLQNVFIASPSGVGINFVNDAAATGQTYPYGWHMYHVKINGCGAQGVVSANHTDATWVDVHVLGNSAHTSGHGFSIAGPMPNSRFIGCKAEWAGTGKDGFHLTGAWGSGTGSGGMTFVGCSTDRNDNNGFGCTATGTVPIVISGCMFRRDGRNAGSGGGAFAGINLNGSTLPITIDGVSVFTGVDDTGSGSDSPQYGLAATNGAANVAVTSGYLQGDTAGTHFGTGLTNIFINPSVTLAAGSTSSPALSNQALSTATAAEVDVANTNAETQIVALTLPGGRLAAGTTYRITLQGTVQVKATSGTLTFRPYVGATVAGETLQMGSQGSAAGPVGFWAEMYVTVRTAGASGTYIAHGHGEIELASRVNLITSGTSTAAVDTTQAAPVIQLTAQWATADPANSLVVTVATIEPVT